MATEKSLCGDGGGNDFQLFEYDLAGIGVDQVEIDVESCEICHSDVSMRNNEWQMTQYSFVRLQVAPGSPLPKGRHQK